MSTFDERWDKRRKQQPPLPYVPGSPTPPRAGAEYSPLVRVAGEVASSYRLADNLHASAILTLVVGLIGSFILGYELGNLGATLVSASTALFLYFLIRWLEWVLKLLASMAVRMHGLEKLER